VATSGRSKRERREWARQKVRKLVPVGVLLGVAALIGVACMIPGWIRGSHLNSLGNPRAFARESAALNLAGGSALESLLAKVRSGKFDGAGGAAAMALANSGPPGVERLSTAATDPKAEVRACAAFGLGLSRDPAAVPVLAKMLASDEEKPVRIEAARALGMIRAPAAVAALVGQAEAESEVRTAVQAAVLTAACPEARDQLIAGLGAPTEEMRSACAMSLIATGRDVTITAEEIEKLHASSQAAVRAGAVGLLALMQSGPFEEILPKALADGDQLVRAAAADAAGLRRWGGAAETLEKMVVSGEEKPSVRISAARALGRIGRLESVLPLANCVADVDCIESVRITAAEALGTVAVRHKFEKLTAKGEYNDHATHIKLAAKTTDVRWEALRVLVAGCGSFKSEALSAKAFEAMRALAGRKLAPKAEVWKTWMENKLDEGRVLGEIAHLVEAAYKLGKKDPKSYTLVEQAMRKAKGLRKRAEEDDVSFYGTLFSNLCEMLGLSPKKELAKENPPEALKDPGAEEKKEEEKPEEKKD
jgi:HEAT repeat protein